MGNAWRQEEKATYRRLVRQYRQRWPQQLIYKGTDVSRAMGAAICVRRVRLWLAAARYRRTHEHDECRQRDGSVCMHPQQPPLALRVHPRKRNRRLPHAKRCCGARVLLLKARAVMAGARREADHEGVMHR